MKPQNILIFIFLGIGLIAKGQSTLSLDLFPVGLHVYDRSRSFLFENKIDFNGNAVVEPGAMLTYEFFVHKTSVGFQLHQALFYDAAAMPAGWTQFSFRLKLIHIYKHKISLAAGPALTYRQGWYELVGYEPEDFYEPNGDWEFRWAIPVQLQYNYYTGKRSELNISLLYHYERHVVFPTIGFKFWLNTLIKNGEDCDCNNSFNNRRLKDWFR